MPARIRIPAEWERHDACWLAFPHCRQEWLAGLDDAQRSIAALCRTIAGPGNEPVRLLVHDASLERRARSMIGETLQVAYVQARYGDCWLRDTTPLLGHDVNGALGALQFVFNGWGGKFDIPFDEGVGSWLSTHVGAHPLPCPVVLEGGALESNGSGTFLTTASCVLHQNRNPELTREAFERELGSHVVLARVIWLDGGIRDDHTDGHVDMLARFAANDLVLCTRPDATGRNADVLESAARRLHDAGLEVLELPAPPEVRAPGGDRLPATYANFYVCNEAVIVPTYGVSEDEEALRVIGDAFGGRRAIGLPARDLLVGGGAFHCVTQPQPARP